MFHDQALRLFKSSQRGPCILHYRPWDKTLYGNVVLGADRRRGGPIPTNSHCGGVGLGQGSAEGLTGDHSAVGVEGRGGPARGLDGESLGAALWLGLW